MYLAFEHNEELLVKYIERFKELKGYETDLMKIEAEKDLWDSLFIDKPSNRFIKNKINELKINEALIRQKMSDPNFHEELEVLPIIILKLKSKIKHSQ